MILCGGLSYDTVGRRACLTVMHGKSTAVLEMDYSIVDFLTLCETPYPNGKSLDSSHNVYCAFKNNRGKIQLKNTKQHWFNIYINPL